MEDYEKVNKDSEEDAHLKEIVQQVMIDDSFSRYKSDVSSLIMNVFKAISAGRTGYVEIQCVMSAMVSRIRCEICYKKYTALPKILEAERLRYTQIVVNQSGISPRKKKYLLEQHMVEFTQTKVLDIAHLAYEKLDKMNLLMKNTEASSLCSV